MSNKGSDNQSSTPSDTQLDAKQEWASQNLWLLAVLFGVSIVLCFLPWFLTVLFMPANDMLQGRDEVLLKNGGKITVQYPVRFLADDSARPVYLTTDSAAPVTITVKLDPDLPLILTGVAPDATSRIKHNQDGNLVITWPLSISESLSAGPAVASGSLALASAPSSTSTPSSAVVPFPVVSLPNTVMLYFKNAGTESGWFPWLVQASLNIDESVAVNSAKGNEIVFDVETTNRASWRSFAEKYSFIVILPFLVAAITFLFTAYANRRRIQKKQAAHERLAAFKTALITAESDKAVSAAWNELRNLHGYLSDDDQGRADLLYRVSRGEVPSNLEPEFNTWSDVWVGALVLAGEALTQQSQPDQHNTALGQTTRSNGASSSVEHTQSMLAALYRCIRIFPLNLVSPEAEERLRKLREKLRIPASQTHDWPKPVDPPTDYPQGREDAPPTIETLGLFPSEIGNALQEIGYLFSEQAAWYWREHPLYVNLKTCLQPVLICGDTGSGRTALALALTRFAEREEKVLSCYQERPASLAEAQGSLGQELLQFICQRSTLLSNLTRDDRQLLASVLLSVLDERKLLSYLSEVDPAQFTIISKDDKANLPLWQAQAQVELRLLSDSVKQMTKMPPLLGQQWFNALNRCVAKLGFARVRIALDLTGEDFHRWRCDHSGQFRSALSVNPSFPVQLILLVPGSITDLDGTKHGFVLQQLRWDANSDNGMNLLLKMLHYRYERGIGGTEFPMHPNDQRKLCIAAEHNPRRLARLWSRIASEYPKDTRITTRMVNQAKAELERP
jgi:hypothetical protein